MKQLRFIIIALVMTSIGCAITSQNIFSEGTFWLNGGKQGRIVWSERLKFRHMSWFKQTTLVYDILFAKITKNSPFYRWFSEDEKNRLFRCAEVYIYLDYSQDTAILPRSIVNSQLRSQGYTQVEIAHFFQQLKNHPQYKTSNLMYYSMKGFCRGSEATTPLNVSLPGF